MIHHCFCIQCVRKRIGWKNAYYKKQGMIDLIKPLPDIKKYTKDCSCLSCVKARKRAVERSANKSISNVIQFGKNEARVFLDFRPHGPGRYDWDRTTDSDYKHTERESA